MVKKALLACPELRWNQCRAVCTAASAPRETATPSCKGESHCWAGSRTAWQRHFEARRRKVSPTIIGRTSPPRFGKACKAAPAMWGANSCTTSAKWAATSSPWAELRASRRWSPRRPDGPAALPRRKLRTAATTSAAAMSGTSVRAGGPSGSKAARAGWARGCLARSLSITPGECWMSGGATKAAQARESSPSAASWRHRACRAERSSSLEQDTCLVPVCTWGKNNAWLWISSAALVFAKMR